MKVLKQQRVNGVDDVMVWQNFLRGRGFNIVADGAFGPKTAAATREFQRRHKLKADGVVGSRTYARAGVLGFALVEDETTGTDFPPVPADLKVLSSTARARLFGTFAYTPEPTFNSPERIRITDGWNKRNIVRVRVTGVPRTFWVHQKIRAQVEGLLETWRSKRLLAKILTYNGSYNPRFIRGSRENLSNHSWGTALDFNARTNKLGHVPALVGERGSVRELVAIANAHGFFWGGHYRRRLDGMHFEAVKVL
jgi:hypothetical protein